MPLWATKANLALLTKNVMSSGANRTTFKPHDKGKELYGKSGDPHNVIIGENKEMEDLVFRLGSMETDPKVSPQSS
ncbi:hypothetical protein PanWU01x14_313240 [Parasponia andersonii]|uniref:Uncharacterized protein n=1 Tax=Parasponia andersonii TaxID=3476 RepID=A0A2P5AP37_PARAD|nr:hypothetical protein PanWU01x14_313240 [Parasponia andersonii]